MDRLFLDANVLFSAALHEQSGIARLWEISGVELVTSTYAVEEALRNLPTGEQRQRLRDRLTGVQVVAATVLPESSDAIAPDFPDKDIPIVFGAVASKSTHLITGDRRHFGKYYGARLMGVLVLRPADYISARIDDA